MKTVSELLYQAYCETQESGFAKCLQTRDGKRVGIKIVYDCICPTYPVRGFIEDNTSHSTWTELGFLKHHEGFTPFDLVVVVPKKHVQYLNFYLNYAFAYSSRTEADKGAFSNRLACLRVEFEEGRFDP